MSNLNKIGELIDGVQPLDINSISSTKISTKKDIEGTLSCNSNQEKIISHMKKFIEYKLSLCKSNKELEMVTLSAKINSPYGIDSLIETLGDTSERFGNLENQLFTNLVSEGLKKLTGDLNYNSQALIDTLVRNLFERSADVGFLSQDCQIIKSLLSKETTGLEQRLKSYIAKYSVYDDVIIYDKNGKIFSSIGNYDSNTHLDESLFRDVVSKNEFIETYDRYDKTTGIKDALMFYQKILSESGELLGVLALSFKFEDEVNKIFENIKISNSDFIPVLLSSNKNVIFSGNNDILKQGQNINFDMTKDYQIINIGGKEYVASGKIANDYEGFRGLGSIALILLPVEIAFKEENISNLNSDILASASNLCPELNEILLNGEEVNSDLSRVVWNGEIMSIAEGKDILRPILTDVNKIGNKVQETISSAIESLYITILSGYLKNASNYSSLMIDLMDRNLYERANDSRWWTLDNRVKDALKKGDIDEIKTILTHTNSLYTVYDNIYVFDKNGKIITSSFLDELKTTDLTGKNISKSNLDGVLKIQNEQQYHVSDFEEDIVSGEITYTYFAKISDGNNFIGGMGLSFDSSSQFEKIISDCIPNIDGNFGLFVDNDGKIISSNSKNFEIGDNYELSTKIKGLKSGEGFSDFIEFNGEYYILGVKKSSGYREYKNNDNYKNDIFALSFIRVGEKKESYVKKSFNILNDNNYDEELVNVSSFVIGNNLYGFKSSDIVEAINIGTKVSLPGNKKSVEFNIQFEGETIPVLNLEKVFNQEIKNQYHQIVVISTSKGNIGILVNDLNKINHFNKSSIGKLGYSKIVSGVVNTQILEENNKKPFLFSILDKEILANYK